MLAGGIDLATGATVSLGTVIAASLLGDSLGSTALGSLAVLLAGAAIGAVTGSIVALLRLPAIIVSLAGSFIVGGLALLVMPRPGGAVAARVFQLLVGGQAEALLPLGLVPRAAARGQADGTPAAGPDPARLARPAGDAARPRHRRRRRQPAGRLPQRDRRGPRADLDLHHLGRPLGPGRPLRRGPDRGR